MKKTNEELKNTDNYEKIKIDINYIDEIKVKDLYINENYEHK
ncbi:hypothetical protein [Tepidibacter thalassicus]|uniref:Uncharacterized protein n=1 Tax=Tepidibacter thalassicus DSM 15285 TaxID=1123350 RepID=A0A1M5PXT9_9FIRM|nr:hypothetical protein [Tepidibacter thalassicus]SHH06516.1 hypothetical protein SAMN02744040_00664 [Tepidibacter thalassicus DSM 15285]